MSTPFSEQFATAQKAGLDMLLGLTTKTLGSVGEIAELNWQAVKSTLAENQEFLSKAFSARNPEDMLSLPAGMTQPAIDRAVSYGRQVSEIMLRVQGDFSATTAALAQQYLRGAQALFENLANKRPG
jgi:phasin family protein